MINFNERYVAESGLYGNNKLGEDAYRPIYIYTKDNFGKYYKTPVFRIDVYDHKNDKPYLNGIFGGDYLDTTMIFTLEPEPKWLQDYNKIYKQLNGNMISKEHIGRLISFIQTNYDLFRSAWDVNTKQFNAPDHGFMLHDVKFKE